jgi:hypothetical protein
MQRPPPLNIGAAPRRVIGLSKIELEELKSHIDEDIRLSNEDMRIELIRVIERLLSNRLPGTDGERRIVNLQALLTALENNRDTVEAIRSTLLGEFMSLLAATQAGGKRRRKTRGRRRRSRRHR